MVFARSADDIYTSTSGLNGYGIPYQAIIVPAVGITLPILNSSATAGNYGGIIIHGEVSYDYGVNGASNWSSAFSTDQWNQLFAYQLAFGIRMVRLDIFPGPTTDTALAAGGCCNAGVEQLISFTDTSEFPTAGLVVGAGITSQGLYHDPAIITNSSTTTQIAAFGPSSDGTFNGSTVAAVINNFNGRQQMAWFTSFATQWSVASNYVQHSWIHWMTRGVFAGRRRTLFNTQIDDVHLITDLYSPNGTQFRLRTQDLDAHVAWMQDINSRMPAGSSYIVELGHNGNGDIENATASNAGASACNPGSAIEYDEQIDTALEFQKPLGSGANIWPDSPATYAWSPSCAKLDALASWFMVPANRDAYAHVSHTFSHMALNNATYSDTSKEISFNRAWMNQSAISNAKVFSTAGLIPPAITGLHNGDAIKAWMDNGITAVVGDNTRPILMNTNNEYWPLITTVAGNGYDGLTVMPRWATTIYYNCDLPACTLLEWQVTSGGKGDIDALLLDARTTNTRHLLSLHQDPFMFHQANLRHADVPTTTINGKSGQYSLLMTWVETIVAEITRLTTWAIVTQKHDDLAVEFRNRMARDACNYNLNYGYSADGTSITSVIVTAGNGNTCSAPIPVTLPGDATISGSGTITKDKVGNDPMIIWVTLNGSPITLNLLAPVAL